MQLVQLDAKRALAFGLSWTTTDALSVGEQLRRAYRDGGRHMAKYAGIKTGKGMRSSDDNFGYAKEFKAPKGVKTLSAAGQLAVHPKWRGATVLVVIEAADAGGMVAVVGLLRGNVIADAIAPRADANRLIDSYRDRCRQANADYRQVGTGEGSEAFGWLDFIPPAPARFRSPTLVKVLPLKPGNQHAWVAAGVLIAAVGGVAYYVIDEQEQEATRLRKMREREQEDPAYQYRLTSQLLLTTPTLRPNAAIRQVREAIGKIPVLQAGWKLKDIVCNSGGCTVSWDRNEGTYAEFAERAWAEWQPLTLSEDLKTITHRLPLKLVGTTLPARTDWPSKENFLRTEASRWQRLADLKISLAAEKVMGLPPGKDERQFANLPGLIYGAHWNVNEAPWWTSELLDDTPDNMTVETITVKFNGNQMLFTTNGIVYVQR